MVIFHHYVSLPEGNLQEATEATEALNPTEIQNRTPNSQEARALSPRSIPVEEGINTVKDPPMF